MIQDLAGYLGRAEVHLCELSTLGQTTSTALRWRGSRRRSGHEAVDNKRRVFARHFLLPLREVQDVVGLVLFELSAELLFLLFPPIRLSAFDQQLFLLILDLLLLDHLFGIHLELYFALCTPLLLQVLCFG